MQTKKTSEIVVVLTGKDNKSEKRKIIVRAIMEDQVKFLQTVKKKWGDEFYSEIVADCWLVILGGNVMNLPKPSNEPQIQLELPDYSQAYWEWKHKQEQKEQEKSETVVIIDIY